MSHKIIDYIDQCANIEIRIDGDECKCLAIVSENDTAWLDSDDVGELIKALSELKEQMRD